MQALFTHALRQTQSINSDLGLLEASLDGLSSASPYDGPSSSNVQGNGIDSAGLNGQIVASLAALQRTVDDYENMAKRELVESNKAKSAARSERIRNDYTQLKKRYDTVKSTQALQRANADRAALFSTGSSGQYSNGTAGMQQRRVPQSPALGMNESPFSMPARTTPHTSGLGRAGTRGIYAPRTNAALDEHSFIHDTGSQLDSFIAQGQAVLGNLTGQRDMLKGTQRRLLSAANTLGLSRTTIQFIERRSKGDMIVFIVGSALTFISFIVILRYFG